MIKQLQTNYINHKYIILLFITLCGIIIYMVYTVPSTSVLYPNATVQSLQNNNINYTPRIIEGFSFIDKPSPTKLGERRRENFLANEIKQFAFNTSTKEHMTNSPLNKLKSSRYQNNKTNKHITSKKSKLNKLARKGQIDEFQDVLDEVDTMDVSSISIKGISDTIRRYNENIENRLTYAKQKNNSSELESAMSQFNVLKDEFVKIFAFADYI